MNSSSAFGSMSSRRLEADGPATRLSRPIVTARVSSLSADVVRILRCATRLAERLFEGESSVLFPRAIAPRRPRRPARPYRVVRSGTQLPDDNVLERAGRHRPVNIQVRLDMTGRRGDPGAQHNGVDKEDAGESNPSQEMCRKHYAAPYIVAATTGASSPQNSTNSASKLAWAATETFNPSPRSDSPNLRRSKAYTAKRSANFGTTLRQMCERLGVPCTRIAGGPSPKTP